MYTVTLKDLSDDLDFAEPVKVEEYSLWCIKVSVGGIPSTLRCYCSLWYLDTEGDFYLLAMFVFWVTSTAIKIYIFKKSNILSILYGLPNY